MTSPLGLTVNLLLKGRNSTSSTATLSGSAITSQWRSERRADRDLPLSHA
ncbi:MAG: hypothetical protein HC767_08045 [Akkermansiaceae bacterium]|nr:hypothetical protein [Akkermansiaceae bacterium]